MPRDSEALSQHLEEDQTLRFCFKSVSQGGQAHPPPPSPVVPSFGPEVQFGLGSQAVLLKEIGHRPSPNLRGQRPWRLRPPLPQCNWQKPPFGLLGFLPSDCVWNESGAVAQPLRTPQTASPEITPGRPPPSVVEPPSLWSCVPHSAFWGPGQVFAARSWLYGPGGTRQAPIPALMAPGPVSLRAPSTCPVRLTRASRVSPRAAVSVKGCGLGLRLLLSEAAQSVSGFAS